MWVTWKFLQFAPGKGSGCARTAVGVALQHTQLSSAWSVLHCWMGAVGCVPAGQLSAQPGRDGAGSKSRDNDSTRWGIPTRHPLLGYCNRKNRQKKPNKQPNLEKIQTTTIKSPKPKPWTSPSFTTRVLGRQQANNYPNYSTCQGSSRSRTILLPSTTALSLSYLSRVPHPAPNIFLTCPCFSPWAQFSYLEHREQIELHWGIYTQALKGLHSTDTDGLQRGGFFCNFPNKLLQEIE